MTSFMKLKYDSIYVICNMICNMNMNNINMNNINMNPFMKIKQTPFMKLMYDSIYKTFRMNEIITLMYDTFSDTYVGLQI